MLLRSEQELIKWRSLRWNVSVATGCFDVLHVGHARLIDFSARQGQFLLLGINSDKSVRMLKGESRPINSERDRAEMLLSIKGVCAVYVFDDLRATRFLSLAKPSTWIKGGDYTLETLDQDERNAVEITGGKIVLFNTVNGYSTTSTLTRANQGCSGGGRNVDLAPA